MRNNEKGNKNLPDNIVIEAVKINKWYQDYHALKDVSLRVRQGERVVICGPSGSGKSTFIRCINRLETILSGRLNVNGVELTDDMASIEKIRANVGMVFQQFNLFPHMTIMENCKIGPIKVRKASKEAAEKLAMTYLKRVQISDQSCKYPGELSGGQQQRVAIARALCMKPNIMLFDEPTSALDPEMIKEVLDVMSALADEGMTMLCVTHEMDFAQKIADTIVFMDEGKIIEISSPSDFFSAPKSERARQFLDKIIG